MSVLITGANGFIGRNLILRLGELGIAETSTFTRGQSIDELRALVGEASAIIHLAGENRPQNPSDFEMVNGRLTEQLCSFIKATNRQIPLIFASSIHADNETPYGCSKRSGEEMVSSLAHETGNPCVIFRLPNVFGKWCRPNYNSVVATFCHNVARGHDITVNDPSALVTLAYIDDVVDAFIIAINKADRGLRWAKVEPQYRVTVGELATQIQSFADARVSLVSERVGTGLTRALYATYISNLPAEAFAYNLPIYSDHRGVFVEMLKTPDCGQFSYFTAHPGITRGGHYHHTKSEKFLVLKGCARFRFRHVITDEHYELVTSGGTPAVVETIPGWSHDITNIGDEELIVMLWANEIFDRAKPDTISRSV
jgi:UDP-2-acetamido-2,6-beta-L-arabino-hexul-4-ose reductase